MLAKIRQTDRSLNSLDISLTYMSLANETLRFCLKKWGKILPKEQYLKLTHMHAHPCGCVHSIHMYIHTHTHTSCRMIQPLLIDSLVVSFIHIYIHSPQNLVVKPLTIFPKEATTAIDTKPWTQIFTVAFLLVSKPCKQIMSSAGKLMKGVYLCYITALSTKRMVPQGH